MGTGICSFAYLTRGIQVTFNCGILGQFFHSGLTSFSNKNFTAIQPQNASKEIAQCRSIATYNIGLVSIFAPLNVGTWESIVSFHWIKN